MKKENLIGLHAIGDYKLAPSGTVKNIIKEDDEWYVIIQDENDGDIEKLTLDETIFYVPYVNKWSFEYCNGRYDIDGDEQFNKNTLWLDAKITKEQAIEIITKLYAGNDYLSLRNMHIIDYETREFKV